MTGQWHYDLLLMLALLVGIIAPNFTYLAAFTVIYAIVDVVSSAIIYFALPKVTYTPIDQDPYPYPDKTRQLKATLESLGFTTLANVTIRLGAKIPACLLINPDRTILAELMISNTREAASFYTFFADGAKIDTGYRNNRIVGINTPTFRLDVGGKTPGQAYETHQRIIQEFAAAHGAPLSFPDLNSFTSHIQSWYAQQSSKNYRPMLLNKVIIPAIWLVLIIVLYFTWLKGQIDPLAMLSNSPSPLNVLLAALPGNAGLGVTLALFVLFTVVLYGVWIANDLRVLRANGR